MMQHSLIDRQTPILAAWRPHTERPGSGTTTALIAAPGECSRSGDGPFLLGIYLWRESDSSWVTEDTCARMSQPVFWWAAEDELLRNLPRSVS